MPSLNIANNTPLYMPVEDFFFGGCYFFTIYYGFTILSVLYKVRIGKRRLRLQPIIAFTINNGGFLLRFTEEYIQDAIAYSKAVGEAAMADNAARQAVFDKANKAWSEYFRGGPTIDSENLNKLNDLLDTIKDALG
jgi:uncharacterized membrane protein